MTMSVEPLDAVLFAIVVLTTVLALAVDAVVIFAWVWRRWR
jgi:hypothetical protein